jgi:pimeloyl-ACP methyl ester carboxylesterase
MRRQAVGLMGLLLLLAACGGTAGSQGAGPASPSASGSTRGPTAVPSPTGVNIDGCVTEETGKIFEYTRDGNTTLGVIMGKGSAGVVVSYERRGKVCDWLPLADRLVDAGHRVLLFKRNNMVEPEEDTVAMAERLRKEGVTKVFLVGGSMGGRLSALAAGALTFPVAGVVSVSGVVQPEDVAGLKAPFLQVGGDQDGLAPLDMVQAAHDAAVKSADRRLVTLPSRDHASRLFTGDQGSKVLDTVMAFIKKYRD